MSCLYTMGRSIANYERELSVIEIDENQYVVLDKYDDKWIVKKCLIDDNSFLINSEHYMLIDISGKEVIIKEMEPNKHIDDYMVTNEEFGNMKK